MASPPIFVRSEILLESRHASCLFNSFNCNVWLWIWAGHTVPDRVLYLWTNPLLPPNPRLYSVSLLSQSCARGCMSTSIVLCPNVVNKALEYWHDLVYQAGILKRCLQMNSHQALNSCDRGSIIMIFFRHGSVFCESWGWDALLFYNINCNKLICNTFSIPYIMVMYTSSCCWPSPYWSIILRTSAVGCHGL